MRTSVLVVGGGPAGLVAALGLAQRGITVRVVDRAPGPMAESRAKGVQPRTLEVFESLGVVDDVLAAGGRFPTWRSYRAGRVAWEKSIYDLLGVAEPVATSDVPYPETWMVPQWRTETIVRAALSRCGVEVEYRCALTSLELDEHGATATVQRAGHAEWTEQLDVSFVVAADGAASTTRRLLGVPFEGVTRDDERFLIADVRTPDLGREHWHNLSASDDSTARVSVCPLPGTDVFQFVAPLLPGQDSNPPLSVTTVQQVFDARSDGVRARFTDVSWITVSRTNERLASRFRVGPVFLVGDAAHTVPAAGGQGMNTAVQDAHNLAWKLAAALRGAPASLLDSYEEERRPIAARLMDGLDEDPDGERPDIFQLRNNYRGSSLSQDTRRAPGPVRAGDRAPDAPLHLAGSPMRRIFDLVRQGEVTCLAFSDRAATASADGLRAYEHVRARIVDVPRGSPTTAETVQRTYGVIPGEDVAVVVRADGHVGLAADDDIARALGDYLSGLYGEGHGPRPPRRR